MVIDLDATLVGAHSEKEQPTRTPKLGFGFHPLCAFVDHGPQGTGEPLAVRLRTGRAGSDTAADHIAVTRQALAQLPGHTPGTRPGRRVLVRTDGAGATHDFLDYLTSQRVAYWVGFTLPANTADLLQHIPDQVWAPAYDTGGGIRDGAWVAELTGLLDLTGWPAGRRVIARKERPHPGAQLRITDVDGHRVTAFATNTPTGAGHGQLADLELRHRRRARCEDRIRIAPHNRGRRPARPALARLRPEPDLVRGDRPGRGPAGVDADARPARHRGTPVGAHEVADAAVHDPRDPSQPRSRRVVHLAETAPWAHLARQAIDRLRELRRLGVPQAVPG